MIFQGKTSRKLLPFFLAAAFVSSVAGICVPSVADAYTVRNADEERLSGQRMIMEHRAKGYVVEKVERGSYIDWISQRLVECNSDKLNFDDGAHDRWLEPIYTEDDFVSGNAWSNGGVTIVTNKELVLATTHEKSKTGLKNTRNADVSNFITTSNTASVIAHEFAHFARKDSQRVGLSEKENSEAESSADIQGMDFLANVPEYSSGSMIYFHLQEKSTGYMGGTGGYPLVDDMIVADSNYLKKISNGRVVLSYDANAPSYECLRLSVDGKWIGKDGTFENTLQQSSNEQSAYIAGQIATSIQKGYWKKRNLDIIKKDENTVALVAWNLKEQNLGKIIMVFHYPIDSADSQLSEYQKREKLLAQSILNLPKD